MDSEIPNLKRLTVQVAPPLRGGGAKLAPLKRLLLLSGRTSVRSLQPHNSKQYTNSKKALSGKINQNAGSSIQFRTRKYTRGAGIVYMVRARARDHYKDRA